MKKTVSAIMLLLITIPAHAVTQNELIDAGMPSKCVPFARAVSATEGNWDSIKYPTNNTTDTKYCYGAFQFCSGRRSTTGGTFSEYNPGWTPEAFLNDRRQQVDAWTRYMRDRWRDIQRNPDLRGLLGQQLCYGGRCVTIDASALLKGAQFGTGRTSAMAKYARDGSCSHGDANNTSICRYMMQGAGHDASCFTNGQQPAQCDPTPGTIGPGDFPTTLTPVSSVSPSPSPTDINVGANQI